MTSLLRHLRNALVITLLLAATVLLLLVAAAVEDVRIVLYHADEFVLAAQPIPANLNLVLLEAHDAIGSLQGTVGTANRILANSEKPIRLILVHADHAVGEIARASQHAATASERSLAATEKMETLVDNANLLIQQSTVVVAHLDQTVADPNITATLSDIRQASANVNLATSSLAKTSDHVEQYVAKATKPASAVKTLLWKVLSPVATFLGTHF